jgi:hypothetical protein
MQGDGGPSNGCGCLFPMSLFPVNEESNWLQWEHFAWHCLFNTVHCYSKFCCVVTYAIQLCFPAQVFEGRLVILVCFDVGLVRGDYEVSAIH